MKLKNILSAFCLLAAMVSCSMEDDVLNEVTSEIQKQDLNPDREAILSFHLDANDLLTKSTGTEGNTESAKGDKETKLNNCVLALMQGEAVLAVVTSKDIAEDGKVSNVTFLTKVRSGLSVIAIVNVADAGAYQSATTRTELNKEVAIDPNGDECLVKQGEAEIKFTDGFGSSSTTNAPVLNVKIPVTQLAAKIELSEFNVKYAEGVHRKSNVTLTSVSFENLNTKSYVLFGEHALESGSKSFNELNKSLDEGNNQIDGCTAYSYANTTDKADSFVKMTLTFRIGEAESMQAETVTKTYFINRDNASNGSTTTLEGEERGVKRGHLYRVKVNMTINTVDTDIVCYTNDWIYEETTVEMTPAN